ncbi:MAG: hypothetical protein VX413_05480 [Verrucomicrobiota bacterium]|nr:hypothetical protein [Verrucomicrobiota bacterium]
MTHRVKETLNRNDNAFNRFFKKATHRIYLRKRYGSLARRKRLGIPDKARLSDAAALSTGKVVANICSYSVGQRGQGKR